ncbi:helicase-exonuclease AddAB subunit AddA [Paenibacillus thermoaerophilus]|uniref:ATP-dependent helicase/nuclease subunit A n=1 Tax=Paenibacillus thermoaerophilus TaxID=1215385 RepID=A0ABW2UZC1_9BACL|nr:helicase-exonuclease AddAB subunit AddA [Paenibacillus thermoaerophilus]TMV19006.1 helicase-exonuclease AddAB subunit AddA [Paenibacillus thermoaerophilus]
MNGIKPKPPGSAWTDAQWDAIAVRGRNTLVAAAAGSGKTAVLVERIISMISDDEHPIDVDRLLVATFTNAAAAEMRHRIREALEKALAERPESRHLRRQLALVNRAMITTLHSFCLEVLSRHVQTLGLDPQFRIANETEAELLRQEVLDGLLEQAFERGLPESAGAGIAGDAELFRQLADRFAGDRHDGALGGLILQLFDYSQSNPWPSAWLDEMAAAFAATGEKPAEEVISVWTEPLLHTVRLQLEGVSAALNQALEIALSPGGPAPYADTLRDDLELVGRLEAAAAAGWGACSEAFRSASFGKLKACRKDQADAAAMEAAKELREYAKKTVAELAGELFARTPEQYAKELADMAPLMAALAGAVKAFAEAYREAKAAKGLVDFGDLEHYCLQVLRDPSSTPDRVVPSEAALAFRELFDEVLLDEYQDTNKVQEAIVELISRDGPGNRFMVGDVKQSIYRFRLAEPGLFLRKYETYKPLREGADAGESVRIDLARNFRSRREIVDAVNFLFRQIMHRTAAEIDYDEAAELVCGADYPPSRDDLSAELLLIDRQPGESGGEEEDETGAAEAAFAETAALEARAVARRIAELVRGPSPMQVYDRKAGGLRPARYRDVVILLRSPGAWAQMFIEELRALGIPGYAELADGYFDAVEVDTMMSLLRVIDNPLQDIPFAGVLRSPLVGLSAAELARIRLQDRRLSFYEAAVACAASPEGGADGREPWRAKLSAFLFRLEEWRRAAREGSLSELIWRLYRETGYYDYCGALQGGAQRQANLRALYDRARQFESTSMRGLFRFLRFVERMRDSGTDLGAARALGEQDDVVRIMSIHKSKGLEFPIVFVAGIARPFNRRDEQADFLLHKRLGFGPLYIDPERRTRSPSLAHLAISRAIRLETMAEEQRVLYVALTRPKEKLYLVGTVRGLERQVAAWGRMLGTEGWRLPAYEILNGRCYLDWIGRALIRHRDARALREWAGLPERAPFALHGDGSRWHVALAGQEQFDREAAAARELVPDDGLRAALKTRTPVPAPQTVWTAEIDRRLSWSYPYASATGIRTKTSVTEMKRLAFGRIGERDGETGAGPAHLAGGGAPAFHLRRPSFLEAKSLTPTERGTVYHAVFQQLPLNGDVAEELVEETVSRMVRLQMLTPEQAQAVDPAAVAGFFRTDVGRRLLKSPKVYRELPFSYGLRAAEIAPDRPDAGDEIVLVQGVVDCLFAEGDGWVLVDFKTDAVRGEPGPALSRLTERYRLQMDLYARALSHILRKPVTERVLYFIDGSHTVALNGRGG